MVELRDAAGAFLGYVDTDGLFFDDRPSWLLPVTPPMSFALESPDLLRTTFETIEVEWARWSDGRRLLRLRHGDPAQLTHVRRVYQVGATCRTKWGEQCDFIETLARLWALVRFHRLPTPAVIH